MCIRDSFFVVDVSILPTSVILLPCASKAPPNWGVVSPTKSVLTAVQVLSPLRKVVASAVPVAANLAIVTASSCNSATVIALLAISSATITSTPILAEVTAPSAIFVVVTLASATWVTVVLSVLWCTSTSSPTNIPLDNVRVVELPVTV